jgi:hypothetical protein
MCDNFLELLFIVVSLYHGYIFISLIAFGIVLSFENIEGDYGKSIIKSE